MNEFLINNWPLIFSTLFGSGSFMAYFSERKKRKIENNKNEINALKEMQIAYDTFVGDSNGKFSELRDLIEAQNEELKMLRPLKNKVEELSKELHEYKRALNEERMRNSLCINCKSKI